MSASSKLTWRSDRADAGHPPLHFDIGRDFETMKGKLLRLTAEQTDGQVFWDERQPKGPPRTLMIGTNGEAVRFAHPIASVKDCWSWGKANRAGWRPSLSSITTATRLSGQLRNCGRNDRAAFNDERITTTEFAITNAWILHRPDARKSPTKMAPSSRARNPL
jgi:hypothetical protein